MGDGTGTDGDDVPERQDVLPAELRAQLGAVQHGNPESVQSLLQAVLSVGRELDLPQVLRRIVEAAVVLVVLGARGRFCGLWRRSCDACWRCWAAWERVRWRRAEA